MSTSDRRAMNEFAEYRFVKVMRGAPDHRKFRKLARSLKISRFEALGITVALWNLCDAVYPFGVLAGLDAEALADSIGIEHIDPDTLLEAWLDAGLVDDTEEGFVVHGWLNECRTGASAQKRSQRAKKAAHVRHHKDKSNAKCDFCVADANENAPSDASEHAPSDSEVYQGASLSMPDARRETRDVRRKTRRIAPKEKKTRAYAQDDPERPFTVQGTVAAQ